MLKTKIVFLALASLALPSTASAATLAECVAAAVPQQTKLQIDTKYLSGGLDALNGIPAALVAQGVGAQCVALASGNDDEQRFNELAPVIAGYVMREGATAALRDRHKIAEPLLDAAWLSLPPTDRARFGDMKDRGPADDMIFRLVSVVRPDITRGVFNRLDEPEMEQRFGPLIGDIINYAIGRGMMESAQTGR